MKPKDKITSSKKPQKGTYLYINRQKVRRLVLTFASLAMVAIIFYTGVLQYHNTKNIYTVLAAVSAIPSARIAVSYLVIMKQKSIDKTVYTMIDDSIGKSGELIVLYELLISSTEKIIRIDSAAIKDNSVFCLKLDKKIDDKYSAKYIKEFLETENKVSTVKIFNTVDSYVKAAKQLEANEKGKYDENIKKLLLIYSM